MASKIVAKKPLDLSQADSLSNLMDSLQQVLKETISAKALYEQKKETVDERDVELNIAEMKLKQRDNELKQKEAEFAKRESEIREQVKRIETVAEAKERMVNADIKDGQAQKLMAEAMVKLEEVKIREEEILKAQQKLNLERGTYKQKVREEIVNNFLKK